ncbi:sensor histidine kinase [Clostridium oryzae]|uniref:histidine kinase n=1 Tax=Clostridium oryzae TaxID=1450648 RepID=A0A1V4ID59_9CLOT|nr:HAMP domain-containing sensor histidine kinase [Clostridium oryzae]OPJ57901.1 alkaline phosphatase synthesis sensor protein PhoR [Clostridium oryzae]
MEKLLLILALLLIFIFLSLYLILQSSIKNLYLQLKNINSRETNASLLLSSSSKYLRKLTLEINKCIDKKSNTEMKYKKMDRELKDSIANISHDLRTPLTSIMGYIYLLDNPQTSEEEKVEYLNIIKSRTETLKSLISDFYDISRLESSDYSLELTSVNIENILSEILASYYNDFVTKCIEPYVRIDEHAFMVLADESSVKRIFSNLIQNILRYGKSNVSITLKQYNGYILTTFANDAPNLDEDLASKIFERFFTVDSSRSDGSTGLGLAITKKLVETMGHTISSKFEEGVLSISVKWKI